MNFPGHFVAPRTKRGHPRALPHGSEPPSLFSLTAADPRRWRAQREAPAKEPGPRLRERAGHPAGRSRGLRAIPSRVESLWFSCRSRQRTPGAGARMTLVRAKRSTRQRAGSAPGHPPTAGPPDDWRAAVAALRAIRRADSAPSARRTRKEQNMYKRPPAWYAQRMESAGSADGVCTGCGARVPPGAGACGACGGTLLVSHPELHTLAIAHVDCDAFYAAVEIRDDPRLAGVPVIVGGSVRGVVTSACYRARAFGVRSAMPMFRARKLCPDAVIVSPDGRKYAAASKQVRRLMADTTPLVQPVSIDEAFLDLSGTERALGGTPAQTLARLAARIEREVGITVSVGLSWNKSLAKIAQRVRQAPGLRRDRQAGRPRFSRRQAGAHPVGRGAQNGAAPAPGGAAHGGRLGGTPPGGSEGQVRRHGPAPGAAVAGPGPAAGRCRPPSRQERLVVGHLCRRPPRPRDHEAAAVAPIGNPGAAAQAGGRGRAHRHPHSQDGRIPGAQPGHKPRRPHPTGRRSVPGGAAPPDGGSRWAPTSACSASGSPQWPTPRTAIPPPRSTRRRARRAQVERTIDKVRAKLGKDAITKGLALTAGPPSLGGPAPY